jgi:hypothetical protein
MIFDASGSGDKILTHVKFARWFFIGKIKGWATTMVYSKRLPDKNLPDLVMIH